MNKIDYIHQVIVLLKRLALIVLVFSLTRLIFFVFNFNEFLPWQGSEVFRSFFAGIRFDLSSIYYFNLVFILLSLLPFAFSRTRQYQQVLKGLFVVVNGLMVGLNLIDVGYFPIIKRRSGWDMIVMNMTNPETKALLVSYLLGYWYLFIFWVLLIAGMIKFYPKLMWLRVIEIRNKLWYSILLFSISLLIIGGGFGVARGLEGKPLRLISANDYVSPKFTPLLLNTPFSVVNTMGHKTLSGKTYFSFSEAEKYYSPLHQFNKNESFKPRNVVIIILESFSSEYVFGHKTEEANFTPFLDSLISQGLLCSNTVANSYNSRDALPAILAGFPSLERIDYMGSRYSTNNFRGLPFLLKQKNYHTSFFHGGHNGTMSFDIFTKAAGIDNYFGFDEFVAARGKSGIDGGWGIYDDCFFQYMAEEMDKFPEPFFSTLFSLSSHDPYPIPKSIRDKFPEGPLPILKSVAYTDYSLRNFFDTIKTKDWFANTLFVIVADHTSQSILPEYKNPKARFAIPLLFYSPGDFELQGEFKGICQQTDIMPSILDYLNYEKSFIAWGNSVFEDDYRFAVNYLGTTYHIIDSTYFLNFDGYKSWAIFDYQKDPMQKYNQCNTGVDIQCFVEPYLKAYIQQYEYRMINNLMADTLLRFSDDNIAEMGVN